MREGEGSVDKEGTSNVEKESSSRRRSISKVNYDTLNRPANDDTSDGDWEVGNPVDPTTGLWYEPRNSSGGSGDGSGGGRGGRR